MREELMAALDEIILSLNESGKQATAEHFSTIKNQILAIKNNADLKVILNKLMSSGAISQYANFNFKQDQLFENIFNKAKKLYETPK